MTAALSIPHSKSLLHSTELHWMGTAAGSQWNLLATTMPSMMGGSVLPLHIYWSTQLSHVCIGLVVCFDSALNCAPMQDSTSFHSVWMEAWWDVWHKKSEVYQTCSKLKNVSGLLTLALSMGFLSSPGERYGPGCQHKMMQLLRVVSTASILQTSKIIRYCSFLCPLSFLNCKWLV
jgi:hypothetical protein